MMQQGEPVADVLYYYGDQVPNYVRLKRDDPAGALPGYDYDVTDTEALLHRMVVDARGLHTPEGIHYRMLVLPPWRIMPLSVLELVDRYLRVGGVVVGERPLRPQGIVPAAEELRYQQLASKTWGGCSAASPNAGVRVGRGTLFCGAKARDAFAALHMLPDFESESPAVDYIHRRTATADIYFIRNGMPEALTTAMTFRVANLQPEIFDPVTGNVTPAMLYERASDGRTNMSVSLAPYESIFIVFRRPAKLHLTRLQREGLAVSLSDDTMAAEENNQLALRTSIPGAYSATLSNGRRVNIEVSTAASQQLIAGWTLDFPPNWGAPVHVDVPALKSWTEFSDPGIRYFSGTATYRTTVHIDADQLDPNRELWLDLGEVYEVARIRINGTPLTPLWKRPYSARIDTFLHPGDNALDVELTNLWPNRLIGDAQPGVTHRYTWTNIKKFTASSPLLTSGMLGPVILKPVYVRSIPLQ
jgi:hypothetical protein